MTLSSLESFLQQCLPKTCIENCCSQLLTDADVWQSGSGNCPRTAAVFLLLHPDSSAKKAEMTRFSSPSSRGLGIIHVYIILFHVAGAGSPITAWRPQQRAPALRPAMRPPQAKPCSGCGLKRRLTEAAPQRHRVCYLACGINGAFGCCKTSAFRELLCHRVLARPELSLKGLPYDTGTPNHAQQKLLSAHIALPECKQSNMTHLQTLLFERHLNSAALLSISVHGKVLCP